MSSGRRTNSSSFDIDDLPPFRVTDIFCKFDRIALEFSEDYLSFVNYEDCNSPDIPQALGGLWKEAAKTDLECPLEVSLTLGLNV